MQMQCPESGCPGDSFTSWLARLTNSTQHCSADAIDQASRRSSSSTRFQEIVVPDVIGQEHDDRQYSARGGEACGSQPFADSTARRK
mmetsp:Transcript_5658/g.15015  ORF Transcript_5658/g.15015 Transcript_5658/m.15015 type:complete len:87 (-) Transcript_5658:24-284(-)